MSNYIIKRNTDSGLSHSGIKGMKWGRRRYQNEDGTLTELGKKRYSKQLNDAYDNEYKKGVETGLKNPKKSAEEIRKDATERAVKAASLVEFDASKEAQKDLESANTVLRETGNVSRTASNAVRNVRINVERMDLSQMTDKEMRERIAREQLESQYDSMFNANRHRVENGKQVVASILEGIGTAASITTSALAIALAVKQLRGS